MNQYIFPPKLILINLNFRIQIYKYLYYRHLHFLWNYMCVWHIDLETLGQSKKKETLKSTNNNKKII